MSKSKKTKSVLPKQIGGIKIPKSVRKGDFVSLLTSPVGLGIISSLVTAGAGAKAAKEAVKDGAPAKGARSAVHGLQQTADGVADSASTLTYALTEAARVFVESLKSGPPPSASESPAEEPVEPASTSRRRSQPVPQRSPASH